MQNLRGLPIENGNGNRVGFLFSPIFFIREDGIGFLSRFGALQNAALPNTRVLLCVCLCDFNAATLSFVAEEQTSLTSVEHLASVVRKRRREERRRQFFVTPVRKSRTGNGAHSLYSMQDLKSH